MAGRARGYDVTLAEVWRHDRAPQQVPAFGRREEAGVGGRAVGRYVSLVNQERACTFLIAHGHFRSANNHFTVTVAVQVADRK